MKNGNGKEPLIPARPTLIQPKRQICKVQICIPSRGVCDAGFTFDLANMMAWTTLELVSRGMDIAMHMQMSSYIHANRTDLASLALQDKAVTHLLWLDDDMRFPKNTIARLLQHHVPFVGVNYSHRKPPPQPVACKRVRPKERFQCAVCDADKGKERGGAAFVGNLRERIRCPKCGLERWCTQYRLVTNEHSTGLEPVEAIGFGVVLIEREVFEQTKFPWFEHAYDHDQQMATGEDVFFCEAAQAAGFPVLVDHDLSKEVRHCGNLEYSLEHANNWNAIALEQQAAKTDQFVKDATEAASKPQLVVTP